MRRHAKTYMFVLASALVLSVLFACRTGEVRHEPAKKEKKSDVVAVKPAAAEGRPTIGRIVKRPFDYDGREVVIEGRFRGWSGDCGSPPKTRSDWVIDDRTGCIYVSGAMPDGLSATKPRNERLSIRAVVRASAGKAYLEAKEARVLPPLRK